MFLKRFLCCCRRKKAVLLQTEDAFASSFVLCVGIGRNMDVVEMEVVFLK